MGTKIKRLNKRAKEYGKLINYDNMKEIKERLKHFDKIHHEIDEISRLLVCPECGSHSVILEPEFESVICPDCWWEGAYLKKYDLLVEDTALDTLPLIALEAKELGYEEMECAIDCLWSTFIKNKILNYDMCLDYAQ